MLLRLYWHYIIISSSSSSSITSDSTTASLIGAVWEAPVPEISFGYKRNVVHHVMNIAYILDYERLVVLSKFVFLDPIHPPKTPAQKFLARKLTVGPGEAARV